MEASVCTLEEPVAPPQPSRPVLSAQQNDNISRIRSLADHVFSRSCTHNSTDLHTFCHIVRMINLFYIAGCQTDLVTIRTITAGSTTHQFFLRKLSFQCLIYRIRLDLPRRSHALPDIHKYVLTTDLGWLLQDR